MKVIKVKFSELNSDLQSGVIKHTRRSERLVPMGHERNVIEMLIKKYEEVEFNEEEIIKAIRKGKNTLIGTVNYKHEFFVNKIPLKFYKYIEEHYWIGLIYASFIDNKITRAFQTQHDEIEVDLKKEFLPTAFKLGLGDTLTMDMTAFKEMVDKIIEDYSDDDYVVETWNSWLNMAKLGEELFFQDIATITRDEAFEFYRTIKKKITDSISDDIMPEFWRVIDEHLEMVFNEFIIEIEKYSTDAFISQRIIDVGVTFKVTVDDSGNQLKVVDMDGNW